MSLPNNHKIHKLILDICSSMTHEGDVSNLEITKEPNLFCYTIKAKDESGAVVLERYLFVDKEKE